MRGKKAKALRKLVYGEEFSPQFRQWDPKESVTRRDIGRRRTYKELKKHVHP